MDIVLASKSPRRRELLEHIGIRNFRVVVSNAPEDVEGELSPDRLVEELSLRKGRAVRKIVGDGALVVAADTVVELDGRILGKPRDEADAFAMLCSLSGRANRVFTGVTLLHGGKELTEHEETTVTFRELSDGEIRAYIATGESMDKAGAYGIQGMGALLIPKIEGDYFNVMGLPLHRLGRMLSRFGVEPLKGQF